MSETIPLRRTLRVESDRVVVYGARGFVDDAVAECDAVETRRRHFVQGPVDGDASAVLDLFGCGGGVGGGEEVQHAELVVGAPETPCIAVGAIFA